MSPTFRRLLLILVPILFLLLLGLLGVRLYRWTFSRAAPRPGFSIFRPPHEISALAMWHGLIWAGGRDGLYALDPESGALQEIPAPNQPLRYVSALQPQQGRGLWIGHPKGLTLFDGESYRNFDESEGLPDRRVNSLLLDSQGTLWVGTWKGAVAFRDQSTRIIDHRNGLVDDMVRVMMEDHENQLWFGSYIAPAGGLNIPSGDRWRSFTTDQGLPHNNVTSIFEDDRGIVWVGTGLLTRGGCTLFQNTSGHWSLQKTLSSADGLAGEKVRAIFQDSRRVYWISSEYEGVLRMQSNNQEILTEKEGLSSNEVKVFLEDPAGRIWMGTRDGITRFDPSLSGK